MSTVSTQGNRSTNRHQRTHLRPARALLPLAFVLASVGSAGVAAAEPTRPDSEATLPLRRLAYATAEDAAAREIARAPDTVSGWAFYDRGIALSHLDRIDEAARSFADAEARFSDWDWARSLAIYGRANVLAEAGRCAEAGPAFDAYSALLRPTDAARADRAQAYAAACVERKTSDPALSAMTSAIIAGEYAQALLVSVRDTASPYYHYNRGAAFAGLGKTEDAVDAFGAAERRFGNDARGRSLAVWGQARALGDAGRCTEARAPYQHYAALVRATDPDGARQAIERSHGCRVAIPSALHALAPKASPEPTVIAGR